MLSLLYRRIYGLVKPDHLVGFVVPQKLQDWTLSTLSFGPTTSIAELTRCHSRP
jgi:hypothetical protein